MSDEEVTVKAEEVEDLSKQKPTRRIIRPSELPPRTVTLKRPDIIGRLVESKAKKQERYPVYSNWASMMGSPCIRELFHHRVNWKFREMPDPEKQFLFEGGAWIEDKAYRDLQDAGFRIEAQGARFEIKDRKENITGKIDMRLIWERLTIPVEVKGLQMWDAEKLNSVHDFWESSKPWIKKYPCQLLLYMFAHGSEWGFFYVVNKLTMFPNVIWVNLYDHLDYVTERLETAILVNKCIKNPKLLDKQPNKGFNTDPDYCKNCDYFAVCGPPEAYEGAAIENDPEILKLLDTRGANEKAHRAFEQADRILKPKIREREFRCGDWIVTGKKGSRPKMVAHETERNVTWTARIKRIE